MGTQTLQTASNPVNNLGFKDFSGCVPDAASHVCGLGLGFIPTPSFSEKNIRTDLKKAVSDIQRRVLLTDYWGQQGQSNDEEILSEQQCPKQLKVPNPSWLPDYTPSTGVLEYIMDLGERAAKYCFPSVRTARNLCKKHQDTLDALHQPTSNYVFSIADKNLGLTAMSPATYESRCLESLAKTHVPVSSSAPEILDRVRLQLSALYREYVEDATPDWLQKWCKTSLRRHPVTDMVYRIANFRIMPKLHKDGTRQLTGNHCYSTQPWAYAVAVLTTPLRRALPNFLQDADSFLRDSASVFLPLGALLVTWDVVELYPRIRHQHCVDTLRDYFLRHHFAFTHLCIAIIILVLRENYCVFDGIIYKQTVGFAKGVAFGSEIADLYLGAIEQKNLRVHALSFKLFRRYIDDGFMIWLGSLITLHVFLDTLYAGTGLNITRESSRSIAVLLDMQLFRQGTSLLSRLYQKPANAYLYVPYCSEHPPNVWFALIRGELIRYVKRCSLYADYKVIANLFSTRLRARGYPFKVIRSGFKTVSHSSRDKFLEIKKVIEEERVIPFIMTYTNTVFNLGLHKLLFDNIDWLLRLEHFKKAKFIISWRASPKLARTLVTYKYPRLPPASAITIDSPQIGRSQTRTLTREAVENFITSQPSQRLLSEFTGSSRRICAATDNTTQFNSQTD